MTVQNAIAQARAAAAEIVKDVPAVIETPRANNVVPLAPGRPVGLADMLAGGGISVDAWLGVSEHGLRIGNDRTLFDKIKVQLPMAEVSYCYRVRYGQNPAIYRVTRDRVIDDRGNSWADTLATARARDPKANEYRSADLVFISQEKLKSKSGEVLAEPGARLGHSLSVTGFKPFLTFVRAVAGSVEDVENAVFEIDLGFDVLSKNTNEWGILKFDNPKVVVE